MKKCEGVRGCGETKPLEDFYMACKKTGRRRAICKACTKKDRAGYYKRNREAIEERVSVWREANMDKFKRDAKRYYYNVWKPRVAKNTPAQEAAHLVYIVKLFSDTEEFVKIGVTSQKLSGRFKPSERSGLDIDFIFGIQAENGREAREIEARLHDRYSDHSYKPKSKFTGYTECFNIEALNIIKQDFGV